MSGETVLNLLDRIAATSSKIDKQRMVAEGMDNPMFKRTCEYAYNPFKTFGIAKMPTSKCHEGWRPFGDSTWGVLDDLIARKLTGRAAEVAVMEEVDQLFGADSQLFVRILRKDLRAGFGESTINKVCKGLIPDFPYMRCSLPKDADLGSWPWADGVISQEKADGMFANVDHEVSGRVAIRSRQGTEFPMAEFARLAEDVAKFTTPGHQLHGEFVVLRDGKILDREIGNGVMNHVISGGKFAPNERPIYMAWDQIPLDKIVSKGKYETFYRNRLTALLAQLKEARGASIMLIPTKIVRSLAEAYAHAGELMKQGKEGTVIKHPHAIWKDGTSKEQIKLKLEFEVDLKIVGIIPGAEGTRVEGRAGAFACESSDGTLKVNVTVKNEALRDRVDANPEEFIGKIIPVIANDIMLPSASSEYYSLFLPRMAEADYRKDKTVADDIERILATKEAAILGQSLKKAA